MPLPLMALAGLATAGSNLAALPFDIYGDMEENKLTRRRLANDERQAGFQRLMALVNQSQAVPDRLAGARRLMSIRNSGGI